MSKLTIQATMPESQNTDQTHSESNQRNGDNNNERRGTPPCPPYSPVSPIPTQLAPVPGGLTQIAPPSSSSFSFRPPSESQHPEMPKSTVPPQEPAPTTVSMNENPDAIALESTVEILQKQKQKSIRDIQKLRRIKQEALAKPEEFLNKLKEGKISSEKTGASEEETLPDEIPVPQNVVRMPPINWAKYHIVGEPLDKMHDEQRRRPSCGKPRLERPVVGEGPGLGEVPAQRAPEHVLAAPYRPLVDKLEPAPKGKAKGKRQ